MKLLDREPGIDTIGRNFLWMAWSAGISVANSLVLWIYLARTRDVEELGRFTVVMGLYSLFMSVCSLGLPGYLVTEISRRRANTSLGTVDSFVANAAAVMLVSGLASAIAMCLVGYWADTSQELLLATIVLCLAVLPSGVIAVGEATMVALGRTRTIGLITTLENLIRTAVPIFLIWAGFDLVSICLSLAATRYAALISYLILARGKLHGFNVATGEAKRILLSAPTFAGTIIFSSLIWQGSAVLLGRYSTEVETAKYGAASRFLIPAAVLLASYADVIQPVLARIVERTRERTGMTIARLLRLPLAMALLAAIASPFLSPIILPFLFGSRYADSAGPLDIFALCLIPFCLIMITARAFLALGLQRYDLLANVCGAVLFFGIALNLIPSFGAVGAATAQLAALTFMAVLETALLTKVLGGFSLWPRDSEKRRPRMLMIGMHLTKTRGGITSLIKLIRKSSVTDALDTAYVASQADEFGKAGKMALAVFAAAQTTWHCLISRPDLVYVHVGCSASLYREGALILMAKSLRRVVVTHVHAGDLSAYYPKQSRVGRWLIRSALDSSDSIISVSADTAREIRSISSCDRIVVIPNAIDTDLFRPKPAESKADTIKILFVGAIGRLKGEDDLLNAVAKLRHSGISLKVSIVGVGASDTLPAKCRELGVEHMVRILGPATLENMPAKYAAADIFVLPTRAEGMPMSLIEAMASGLAVVTTRVGGIPEMVDENVSAVLVEPGDVDALAEAIGTLATNAQLRADLGHAARLTAVKDFDFRAYAARLREFLLAEVRGIDRKPTALKLTVKRTLKSAVSTVRRLKPANGVNIIAYHRVVDDIIRAEKDGYFGLSISRSTFRKHCEILRDSYEIMPLESAAEILAQGRADRPIAVLTFDDGYLDFYEQAFPVLREFDLPATMFLPSSFVGGKLPLAHDRIFWLLRTAAQRKISLAEPLQKAGVVRGLADRYFKPAASLELTERLVYLPFELRESVIESIRSELNESNAFPQDFRLLDWSMVREMAAAKISFGAHTVNHVVLPLESPETIEYEVDQCRAHLEERLGLPVKTFAYPNGEHNSLVRSVLARAGFTVAVTTKPFVNGSNSDLLALGRVSLSEESTRGIAGVYSPGVAELRLGA